MHKIIRGCTALVIIATMSLLLTSCDSSKTTKGEPEDILNIVKSLADENKQKVSGTVKITITDEAAANIDENKILLSIVNPIYSTMSTVLSDIDIAKYPLEFEYVTDNDGLSLYTKCNNTELNIIKLSENEAYINVGAFTGLYGEQLSTKTKDELHKYKWVETPIKMTSDLSFKLSDDSTDSILYNITVTKGSNANGKYTEYKATLGRSALAEKIAIGNTDITEDISIIYYEKTNRYRIKDTINVPNILKMESEYNYSFDEIVIQKPNNIDIYNAEGISS